MPFTADLYPLPRGTTQGCYIGQESIARVNSYKALKNTLYGVAFERPGVPERAELMAIDEGKRQETHGSHCVLVLYQRMTG